MGDYGIKEEEGVIVQFRCFGVGHELETGYGNYVRFEFLDSLMEFLHYEKISVINIMIQIKPITPLGLQIASFLLMRILHNEMNIFQLF